MKLFSIICFVVLLICACNSKKESRQLQFIDKTKAHIPKDTGGLYFTLDSLFFTSDKNNRYGDSSIKTMISGILFSLKEPILYNYFGEQEIIRFLWIRPFDNPVVVRVNNLNDTIYANIKEIKQKYYDEENYTYKIGMDTIITIDSKKWNNIISSLQSESFWNTNTVGNMNGSEDATRWILECRVKNKYHCITRTYIDSSSFKDFEYVKELFDLGNGITPMKNSREDSIK